MHKKLNAVMQMDPPGSRRRLVRPPIAPTTPAEQDSSSSPTDADSSNDAVPGGSNSAECRRSSRKKTIKFDVRDLLNKNRKNHKIQIEARIDSNAPKVGANQISKAELDSKQKNFIEKSAIFRRYSISENKLPPRPPPPPGALIHTIQQCVGELEQLPLDGGELNLAAISPIARRLSRTQDILNASMMKPKQVSSLIVTKLESATTSKAAAPPARRRLGGECGPSTSKAVQKKARRGRQPKVKVFTDSTTESSSNDSFDLSTNNQTSGKENMAKCQEKYTPTSRQESVSPDSDNNSTTGIDLKENLDASAVTLPQPTVLNDSMRHSTDESFVASEEDIFTARSTSSDESTTGFISSSPIGTNADEISLFGRSNSTETNSSDDSEKRRRKIRVSVKRVSLGLKESALESPSKKCISEEKTEPVELKFSSNDENSINKEHLSEAKPSDTTKPLKGRRIQNETDSPTPVILIEEDTTLVGSSVAEITPVEEIIDKALPQSPTTRRGRNNCKQNENITSKAIQETQETIKQKPVQKSTVPQSIQQVSLRNRKSPPHLVNQTIAASSPPTSHKDAQIIKEIAFSKDEESEDVCQQKSKDSEETVAPIVRSLRSTQSVHVQPLPASKKQNKGKKVQNEQSSEETTDNTTKKPPAELSDKSVIAMSPKDVQLESGSSIQTQSESRESIVQDEAESQISKVLSDFDSFQSKQNSLGNRKEILDETKKEKAGASAKQGHITDSLTKEAPKTIEKLDKQNIKEDQIVTKSLPLESEEKILKTDENSKESAEEESSKSERESTIDSTDRSDSDTTASDRRESRRLRPSLMPTKKQASKNVSKASSNSSTPDSSSEGSECNDQTSKDHKQTKTKIVNDKSKEETSSLCSESSSIASSSSSSSSLTSSSSGSSSSSNSNSSSTPSSSTSSSSSSSSSSSTNSEGRSTRSSRNILKNSQEKTKVEPIIKKSPNKSDSESEKTHIAQTQSIHHPDHERPKNLSKEESEKETKIDNRFKELEKLMERRKAARLQRYSSENEGSTGSECSDTIQYTSKTRSGRSRGRVEEKDYKKSSKFGLQQTAVTPGVKTIGAEETSTHTTDEPESATNAQSMTQALRNEPRAKSKKRTRRFAPIKDSSSESGALSDDGTPSDRAPSRLTRARRKTISSASELDEIVPKNLSPPDLALEYLPRKSAASREVKKKQENSTPAETFKEDSKTEQKISDDSKTQQESSQEPISNIVKTKKGTRSVSKCPSDAKTEESKYVLKESENNQSIKVHESKQDTQQVGLGSSSSPELPTQEEQITTLRQRKVTRLSLKAQSDTTSQESQDLECSFEDKAKTSLDSETVEKIQDNTSQNKESQQSSELKEDTKTKKQEFLKEALQHVPEVVPKSPKNRKGTKPFAKSLVNLENQENAKEKVSEPIKDKIDQPKEDTEQEAGHEIGDPQKNEIASTTSDSFIEVIEKSPGLRKGTRVSPKCLDSVPSPNIKSLDPSHENLAEKAKDVSRDVDEHVEIEENKVQCELVDEASKQVELAKASGARKATRLSMKKMQTVGSEQSEKEYTKQEDNKNELADSKQYESVPMTINAPKYKEEVKSSKQRKPTRFSPKSPDKLSIEEHQTKEELKNDEVDKQKEYASSPPGLRKTTLSPPKSLGFSKNIDEALKDSQQKEFQPIESKSYDTQDSSQSKSDSQTPIQGAIESKAVENPLVKESLNSSSLLVDTVKSEETQRRTRKPTRFSPRSPDKLNKSETDVNILGSKSSEMSLPDEKPKEAPIERRDEVEKSEELNNLSESSATVRPEEILRSPSFRKLTRLTAKSAQIEEELKKTPESKSAMNLENKEETPSESDKINASTIFMETTELQEPVKLLKGRKSTRFSQKAIDVTMHEDIKNVEPNVKIMGTESENLQQSKDKLSDTTTTPRQKKKVAEKESFVDGKEVIPSEGFKTAEDTMVTSIYQPNSKEDKQTSKIVNVSEQSSIAVACEKISQEPSELTKEGSCSIDSAAKVNQLVAEKNKNKSVQPSSFTTEIESMTEVSVPPSSAIPSSPSISTSKIELTRKGIKKQLQSMLDSLSSSRTLKTDFKLSKQEHKKETTPRRKKKNVEEPQESTIVPQGSPTATKKTDEPIRELDMKIHSSESNQSDDSIKAAEANKIEQKQTPRRQLDSSFIESLEKSLMRPISSKKNQKKKEKEKEVEKEKEKEPTIIAEPKLKEEPRKPKKSQEPSEELKKSDSSSPKTKKKPKDSPKVDKKHSEEHTPSKRKSLAKSKDLEGIKPLEPESFLSDISSDVLMTKQSSEPVRSSEVTPQTPKTKGETKFFSTEKQLIQDEPLPMVEDPVSPVVVVKEKSPELLPDPLKDIEKFIEDGVNLLKRCYKIDADDDASLDRDILKPDENMSTKKCKLDESATEEKVEPTPDDESSNSNSECSTLTINTSTSEVDTPNGIRRSHRIKNNSKSTKCLVGRGLVRERERFSTKDDEKTIYSIDDQKMDLAEVEAKNSKFLKEMEERLSNFRVIRENEYKCERVISKEAKRMLCDCFLTPEEEERGELGCGEDCLNRLLMIECGADCTVRERCTNRRFNKFLYSPCRVFRTEKKGFGIMADIEILPDEFIMEYVGEVINGDEFEHRINEYSKDKNKHYYFMALRSDAVIDATAKGNISRFINHSCDPNAETQKWTVNGELRIGFFSRKSIMPGEEITFDYQYQRYGKEAQRCYCESANCRGWIGEEPSSEEEEYEGVDEEGESEETEEEEQTGQLVPVPIVPTPATAPVIAVPDVELPLVPVVATEVPPIEMEVVPIPQLVPTPITELIPAPEKPKELPPKKKKDKKRSLEEKIKRREPKQFLEDPDIEDEVRFLVKCGLRNQADTLRLSRLIVRAKLLETRIKLLQILRQGELPCRRLFLDYHGLRLLHGWMSEVIDTRDTEKSMEIRMELLSALECLPISNKTMLTDSKVYQTVRDWSLNKESHSPSEGSPKEMNANSSASASPTVTIEEATSELQKLAAKLVNTWDNLPDIFRIPKRERIEQMKEHEREADRQYKGLGEDSLSGSDGNRNRERFMSKRSQKSGFKWSKNKERERAKERRKYAQNNSNAKDGPDKSTSSQSGESHLSKEQRRELFAAKVARDEAEKRQAEERREFDIKCRFFGLDPKRIRPTNMPFCVNPSTGQWYSTEKKPIATPPSYAHVQVPVKPKSTNPEDYRLPQMDLPPLWKFAISPKGKIYYYHVKIRIPQWEPPIKILPLAGQQNTEVKSSESDSSNPGIIESSEDDIDVIKGLDPVKLQAYIEKKIEERKLQRYTRLVEEKPISPRKEEDRMYNQMEVRKYKENKEKIRKRKEEIRKRTPNTSTPSLTEITEGDESKVDALPIQDYLLSSEEEEMLKAQCNNSPIIDKIVQGDKIVDELDALQRKRALKRALPIRDKYEHKKRKVDKNKDSSKSTKRNKDGEGSSSSSSKYRKVREKFRCEIAGIIVQHLKPYRTDSCFTGRILTDDDFNHLARKLTHFVMVKELKYCESIGQTLIVTESVKNKSREFIKKYMAKYGEVYIRSKNDPEFKEIPFL